MSELVTFGETPLQFSPPDTERLETARETTVCADGTESNAAVAASQVGTESTWLSKLPATALSRRVVGDLERHGIETSIAWVGENAGRQGLVFRESGHPPREGSRWHDRDDTATATADPGDLPMELVQRATVVFAGLSTPALSESAAATVRAMLRTAHDSGATTAVDVDYDPGLRSPGRFRETLRSLVDHLDVLVADAESVQTVLDRSGPPRELANALAAELDLQTVVVTRNGYSRAVALENAPGTSVVHECRVDTAEAADPAGRDGAFSGVFLARIADGADLSEALQYGLAAATLAGTVPGPFLTAGRNEVERIANDVVEAFR